MKLKLLGCGATLVVLIGLAVIAYNSLSQTPTDTMAANMTEQMQNEISETQTPLAASEANIDASVVEVPVTTQEKRDLAPDFTVYDPEGNAIKLSELRGKPVVLNFWASWCPPCRSEMPEFDKMSDEVGDSVQFMMVNLTDGSQETEKTAIDYILENGFTFPTYLDLNQEAAAGYGIRGIPTSIFIDKDGYIATRMEGAIDETTLREGIDTIKAS
jgi:thiol-disulfide isomerase/thioredoxin